MECHLQIFVDDGWIDCATVSVRDPRMGGVGASAIFEYDLDYAFAQHSRPVSMQFPVDAARHNLSAWPAFLYDLIPQGNGRKFLLAQLKIADGKSADFALICAGAFNPIGNVRVREATDYFRVHIDKHDSEGFDTGFTLDEIVARGEAFTERMMVHSMLAAGTTGVQGAAPKYLLTRDLDGLWHADGALADERAAEHFIVKLPRGKDAVDKKLLRNEAAYMDVAKKMGIRTYGVLTHLGGMLFVPRFDRATAQGKVVRRHQESAAAVAGVVGFDARPGQFELLHALRHVVTDKTAETIEFLKRDVLNLAMRNTDNHARNTAVQTIGDEVRLTPLFDFAPMYMDPEGISRAARWYHPATGRELTQWQDVIEALQFDAAERKRVVEALAGFGAELGGLAEVMRAAGVDADIIDYLQKPIATQIRQLGELRMD
jgi:serine/threonine-protein kinase HipA